MARAPTTQESCRSALIQSFIASNPMLQLDRNGYVSEAALNLITGIEFADVEPDLRQGDGNELGGKFRAAHSSSALAVNTFAPFKKRPVDLWLPWGRGFTSVHFERKCPHGVPGRYSPNLDVVAESVGGVIAIESKCLEFLKSEPAEFAPAYNAAITDERRQTAWFEEMERLIRKPRLYHWLDAAQLVKHAFGIMYTFPGPPRTLVYLFWEPSNSNAYPIFAEHRAEIGRFAASVAGGAVNFASISYPELWKYWEKTSTSDWLLAHVARLRGRYGVAM